MKKSRDNQRVDETFEVRLAVPERKYFRVFLDFLHSKLLTGDEKLVYIILKSFIDFSGDSTEGIKGTVYPSIKGIMEITSWGNKKTIKVIDGLVKKRVIKKERVGLTQNNRYTLSDFASMWECETVEEIQNVVDKANMFSDATVSQLIQAIEGRGYTVSVNKDKKEKSFTQRPTKVEKQSIYPYSSHLLQKPFSKTEYIENDVLCQDKVYTFSLDDIKIIYNYDILVLDQPHNKADVDAVMKILFDTLNSTKDTIRVCGENKPRAVVVGVLMKLDYMDIAYSIDRFHKTKVRSSAEGLMLTLLYKAKEQQQLEISNDVNNE